MQRVLFEIPGLHWKIHGFGLMLCLAFLAAIFLADWRARRVGLNPDWAWDLAFWILLGGLVGARGLYVWQYWGKNIDSWTEIFAVWEGGIVLYGGVIGALAAGLIRARQLRIPILAMCDAVAPSIALGLAIGRVGCFFNGCCYGDPCSLPWAVRFPAESSAWYQEVRDGSVVYPSTTAQPPWIGYVQTIDDSGQVDRIVRDPETQKLPHEPRVERRSFLNPKTKAPEVLVVRTIATSDRSRALHPTQLYSTIDGLILLWFLTAYYPFRRTDGEVAALLMIAYAITRFLIEQLRGDEAAFVGGLTISQAVSVGILAAGVVFWLWLRSRPAALYVRSPEAAAATGA